MNHNPSKNKRIALIIIMVVILLVILGEKGLYGESLKVNKESRLSKREINKIQDKIDLMQEIENHNLTPIYLNAMYENKLISKDMLKQKENILVYIMETQYKENQQIKTEKRNKYIIENLQKIGVYGNEKYSIIYKNLKDNYQFNQNQDNYYVAASTIKVPYGMHVNDLANQGKINLQTDTYTYHQGDYEAGGGDLTSKIESGAIRPGSKILIKELVRDMIENSDNSSRRVLCSNNSEIPQGVINLFSKGGFIRNQNTVKPRDILNILNKMYNQEDKYEMMLGYMKNAENYWNLCPENIPYAKKYGGYNSAASQIGIVYDKEPYILIIYSSETKPDKLIEISKIIYNANNIK